MALDFAMLCYMLAGASVGVSKVADAVEGPVYRRPRAVKAPAPRAASTVQHTSRVPEWMDPITRKPKPGYLNLWKETGVVPPDAQMFVHF